MQKQAVFAGYTRSGFDESPKIWFITAIVNTFEKIAVFI